MPHQGDLQRSAGVLSIVLVFALLVSVIALADPGGSFAGVLSFLPPTVPMGAPARLIAGEMSAAAVALSLTVMLASTAAVLAVAMRIHANAVLRLGTRVKLRDAWRGRDPTAPSASVRAAG